MLRYITAKRLLPNGRSLSTLAQAKRAWNGRLVLSEEVEHTIESGGACVALETAIVTHGMPYPTNLETAQSVESIIRQQGAIPATIALMHGKVHVGLSPAQLSEIADPAIKADDKVKVSRRDLGAALASGVYGGTTVAGTMILARAVGIDCFVTGGIGGVHRGGENSMDVSADLVELGRTPMAVVCAGAKSILDIPRTLEYLETQGVCVASFGASKDFPAFYSPSSGIQSPWRVSNEQKAANLIHTSLSLPSPLSTLLAVPIPSTHAAAGLKVQQAVEQAVRESIEQGIDKRGKEVTPWLLKRVGELSSGQALISNIALIENNAAVGARVAVELAALKAGRESFTPVLPPTATPKHQSPTDLPRPRVLVFGSAAIDVTCHSTSSTAIRSTTPGTVRLTPGGVGRNVAESATYHLAPHCVRMVAGHGPDAFGSVLKAEMESSGMRTDGLVCIDGARTAVCSLVLEKEGDLVAGVADMEVAEALTDELVAGEITKCQPELVVFDCNLKANVIQTLLSTCAKLGIDTLNDPTSVPKLTRLIPSFVSNPPAPADQRRLISHIAPNVLELSELHTLLNDAEAMATSDWWNYVDGLGLGGEWRAMLGTFAGRAGRKWIVDEGVAQMMVGLLPWVSNVWVKNGDKGLLHLRVASRIPSNPHSISTPLPSGSSLILTHYPAESIQPEDVLSTTGAGDSLVGGLAAGIVTGEGAIQEQGVREAVMAATRSLGSLRAVVPPVSRLAVSS